MYDWINLERARREELLREANEWRMTRASEPMRSRELTTPVRRLIRFLRPERNGGLAASEKPGAPIHGCTVD